MYNDNQNNRKYSDKRVPKKAWLRMRIVALNKIIVGVNSSDLLFFLRNKCGEIVPHTPSRNFFLPVCK